MSLFNSYHTPISKQSSHHLYFYFTDKKTKELFLLNNIVHDTPDLGWVLALGSFYCLVLDYVHSTSLKYLQWSEMGYQYRE